MIAPIEQTGGRQISFGHIETACKEYDEQSSKLDEMIDALQADLEAVKQKHLASLKRIAAVVARREADVNSLIESAPNLFVKPRTITIHGVKVGLTYSQGRLVWDCEDDTLIARIKAQFGREARLYIDVKETPKKDELKRLDAETQKKLGLSLEGEGDSVIVKRVAGDVEKLIDKMLEKLVAKMLEGE